MAAVIRSSSKRQENLVKSCTQYCGEIMTYK